MTIYEIKERTKETSPYFFDKDTLRFFGQRMRDFKVTKIDNDTYHINAPMYDFNGTYMGDTNRFFYPSTNKLSLLKVDLNKRSK